MDEVTVYALAAASLVKMLVDLAKLSGVRQRWLLPMLAIGAGVLVVLLLLVSQGVALTSANVAQAALAGMLAGGSAMGVTALHTQAREQR